MINKPRAGSLSLAQNDVPLQNAFPTPDGPPRQPRTPGETVSGPGSATLPSNAGRADWKEILLRYQKPSGRRALWQVANTLGPYILLWYLIYHSLAISWWLTVPLAVLAGAFLVRVFIIFHDCGHGSFFKSRMANDVLGFVTGILTFTPYHHWKWEHSIHHASAGHLDKRGTGDVWTMTVQEYLASSGWTRFTYRLARNPIVLFLLAPLFLFLIQHRFSSKKANRRERWSVYWMNLAIAAMVAGMIAVFGLLPYLIIQLGIVAVAGSVASGCFTSSISSKAFTGSAGINGTTPPRRCREVPFISCRKSSSGFRATSDSTISII